MRELFTDIEIKTTPEHLFNILTDFNRFSEWNPFIKKITGEAKEGSIVTVRLEPSGTSGMTFKPIIRRVILNRGFCWLGYFILPGLLNGEHCFEIIPLKNGNVRFIQRESFRGILIPLLWNFFKNSTERGFKDMNRALKKRAENSTAAKADA